MSDYFNSLGVTEKERYIAKLEIVGLTLERDPYLPANVGSFVTDITGWPQLEYGHIFAYCIRCPGTYTLEQVLSWKQLDAYNYYQINYLCEDHIHDGVWRRRTTVLCIKG